MASLAIVRRFLIAACWCVCGFLAIGSAPYAFGGGEWGITIIVMCVLTALLVTMLINWVIDEKFKFYFNRPEVETFNSLATKDHENVSAISESFQKDETLLKKSARRGTIISIFKWSAIIHVGIIALDSMMKYDVSRGWPSESIWYFGLLISWISGTVVWGIIFSLLWLSGSWFTSSKKK